MNEEKFIRALKRLKRSAGTAAILWIFMSLVLAWPVHETLGILFYMGVGAYVVWFFVGSFIDGYVVKE